MPFKLFHGQRRVSVGAHTDISINGDGKWLSDAPSEEEVNPFVFSIDDGNELNVDLTEGDV